MMIGKKFLSIQGLSILGSMLLNVSFGTTSLNIPLVLVNGSKKVDVTTINKKLHSVHKPLLPTSVIFSSGDEYMENVNKVNSQVADAARALEMPELDSLGENFPGRENNEKNKTCYIGDSHEVVPLIQDMGDNVYSGQLTIQGYKYKNEVHIVDSANEEQTEAYLNENSEVWKNWKGNDETLLLISSVGDSGDDINESVIPECSGIRAQFKETTLVFNLDDKKLPWTNSRAEIYPYTIKDFREDLTESCYSGEINSAKDIISALVTEANGDGDSWAELKGIKQDNQNALTATVKFEDERGRFTESFKFPSCK